jgi:hypothetical protein
MAGADVVIDSELVASDLAALVRVPSVSRVASAARWSGSAAARTASDSGPSW